MHTPRVIQRPFVYAAPEGTPLSEEKQQVLKLVGAGKRVLEVGAHTGDFTRQLLSRGCSVTAVEVDPVAADVIRPLTSNVITGDFEKFDVYSRITGPYDLVLMMHTLEHMVNPWKALEVARSLLSPGGELIALLPNVAAWTSRKPIFFRGAFRYTETGLMDRTHLRFFNFSTGREMVESAGFSVLQQTGIDHCVPLERRLRLTGVLAPLARAWQSFASARWPNLCYEIMLIRAKTRPM